MERQTRGGTRTSWLQRRADLFAVVALIVAAFVFTSDQVAEHEMMSPIDEYQYVGYYAQVADHGILRQGQDMPLFARRYMVCHGVRAIPEMPVNPAGCRAPNSVAYPIAGGTTADLYTPLYFLATRVLAQPFIWAGVDFVDAGRAVGGVWLGLGAVLLYLAMRRARVPVLVSLSLGLVLVGSLPAYWGTTYISTDAPMLASGALAAWLTMRALDGVRWSLVLLPAAAVVATLFKLQNLIGFVAAAAVLLLTAALAASREHQHFGARALAFVRDRRTLSGVVVVVASVVAQATWLTIRSALAVGPQPAMGAPVPLEFKNLVVELGNFLPVLAQGALSPYATGPFSLPVFTVGTLLAIGGAAGLAMSRGVEASHRIIGLATVVVTVAAAPGLAIAIGVLEGTYFPLPSRYGNSMLPWALLCAGLLIGTPRAWARYALLALGVATWSVALMLGEA
jgi:hypothetical protein